ncbi:MAG: hypothetical protein Q8M19_02860 [Reyranella sp.]|nr:hypothetical protein [Reyranella sp.]
MSGPLQSTALGFVLRMWRALGQLDLKGLPTDLFGIAERRNLLPKPPTR